MNRSGEPVEARLDRLFDNARRWSDLWGLSRLMRDVTIDFSDSDPSRMGRCDLKRMTVTLNARLLHPDYEALLHETLCHELAHVVAACRYGPGVAEHGPEWQQYMVRAGYNPRPVIPEAARNLPGRNFLKD